MSSTTPHFLTNRKNWLLLLLLWAGAVGWSLMDHLQDIREHNESVITESARNMFRMVVLTRQWNSGHAGVYVPVTEASPPNPYLQHARRDITDNYGRQLTMINPAYMTRQIGELAKLDQGVVFRLTSLKPINPLNEPDDWERTALQAFEKGQSEHIGFVPHAELGMLHRYMAPLQVTAPCLKCHAEQGYRLGDIRGGISVTHRYDPFLNAAAPSRLHAYLMHGGVFVIVLLGVWWLLEQLRRRWLDLLDTIVQIEAARNQLIQSEKMASLGRTVAGFAHEINTPIGVAVGAISNSEDTLHHIETLLEGDEVSEEDLRAALNTLRQGDQLASSNLRRAARLIQSFKRTSIDQSSDENRVFSLLELNHDVLAALHNQLKRLPIQVNLSCPDTLSIFGCPGLLEQLLTNLIMNSLIHAFPDTHPGGEIQITWTRNGTHLTLNYHDTGQGMPPSVLENIFEPFFTTRRNQGGSGLGLYICYNIVTVQLHGTIRCDSAPGQGTRFQVDFPAEIRTQ